MSIVAIVAVAALMPLANASTALDVNFSAAENPSVEGARTIVTSSEAETKLVDSGQLELPVLFATTVPLASGASFTNADYNFTLYLATPAGTATVTLGYADAEGNFFPIVTKTVPVEAEGRGALHELGPTDTPVDIGVAHAHLSGVNGAYPAGSFVAIKVEASLENDMFTQASYLGAADQSTATVPLPELTAGLLFIVGLATIAGFAVIRSRKEA